LALVLPAARGGDVRAGARAQLDMQPLREPGRLCRELGRGRAGPGPLLHGVLGGDGDWYVFSSSSFCPFFFLGAYRDGIEWLVANCVTNSAARPARPLGYHLDPGHG